MLLLIFVTLWSILLMYIPYIFGFRQQIIDNWSTYRCSPTIIPIAGMINKKDTESVSEATSNNFSYCVQNIQTSFMGSLLEPVYYVTSGLSDVTGMLGSAVGDISGLFSRLRDFLEEITSSIMSLFYNLIIEYMKIFIALEDLVGKIIGTVLSVAYLVEGLPLSAASLMDGWVGQIIDAACFHPDTIICKQDGTKCKISELSLGDKIDGNSEVQIIMKIQNKKKEPFYKLKNDNNGDFIYVTGSHLIYLENIGYIPVKEYKDAIPTDFIENELICLVTNNHIIKIGKYIFHDWEDDIERYNYEYNKMIL